MQATLKIFLEPSREGINIIKNTDALTPVANA
jgi:hypothetical protein